MADDRIDKSLPNVFDPKRPSPEVLEEIDVGEMEEKGPIEVTPEVDGGATIDFDANERPQIPGTEEHFDNLADLLPDDVLTPIGLKLNGDYKDYKYSRREWERSYITGLDLLGFKYTNRTQPFQGASGATHPVLAEAVTQFQALAYKELLPADGPVRTQVIGASNPQKQQQAERVKEFMN